MSRLLRVLIVEDSEDDAICLLRDLRHGGYEVVSEQVDSAKAMNSALDHQPWDLVISDHAMPGFSALAALAILKARKLDLPFIIVSGNMSEEVAVTAMKAGAHDFFVKGNIARLTPAIERELHEAEVRRAQRHSDEQLHLRQTILECQSEAALDGIFVVSKDKQWLSNNQRFIDMWTIPDAVVQGRSSEAAFRWIKDQLVNPEQFLAKIEDLNTGLHQQSRDEITLKGGSIFESYSAPVKSNDGIYYGRVWYYRDITQRKRAESGLRESEARNRAILESFPDIVFVVDLKREVLFSNPAAAQFLQSLNLHRQLPGEVDQIVAQVMEHGVDHLPTGFDQTYRVRVQNEDRFFLPRVVAMHTKSKPIFGVVVLLQDVTALRLLDQIKSNLIATVSHELKTPVTSLQMALQVLIEETVGALNPQQKEMVAIAGSESERLLKTLNALLDLARFEQGLPSIYLESASPLQLVEAAIEETRVAALSKRLIIKTEASDPLPLLRVDRVRIIHVFTNLLTNAIKHSPKGETILFKISTKDGQSVRFSIVDQGPGIPHEYQSRIFDKFFRVPGYAKTGTGLGLTIAKEFVKAHEGVLGIISEPGQGCTFYVELKIPT